ncbi:hypothetical protein CCS01_24150 [Rhodopila globiformis]|uniref:Acyltransferase 3 domain-containing protein n=2 Tax=Rhodopila globiformis TaxID=1071 RepID=A0A2S6N1E3_RHOGL|nr:hypothetical protein CCS01_24150 [Rhodopila globiformis]
MREFSGGLLWQINPYGQDAVTVFFVLSGFVIAYVTHRRETDAGTYALHRAARIYSVAVPALLLTLMLDSLSSHFGKSTSILTHWTAARDAISFPLGVAFLGEVWSGHLFPGTNGPYWSLGFEVPYYLIFGIVHFGRRPWNWIGALLLLAVFGPKIALMFASWLIGLTCYRVSIRVPCSYTRTGLVLWLTSTVALIAIAALETVGVPIYQPLELTLADMHSYLHYLLLSLMVGINILGLHLASDALLPVARRIGRPIGWLAGASFSLYLFHMPLIIFVAEVSPWPVTAWPTRTMVFIGVPLAALALAEITERRKDLWRDGLLTMANRLRLVSWAVILRGGGP